MIECEFDRVMEELGLVPSYEATQSAPLHRWVSANWQRYYVPEELLVIWGFNQAKMPDSVDVQRLRVAWNRNWKKPVKRAMNLKESTARRRA